ncbi:unnamed protein product, partial [Heterobilharzia americana]
RNHTHSLRSRIYGICSEDTVDAEIETLRIILSNNGYPKILIDKNLKKRTTPHPITVPKNILTMNLEFKGDTTVEVLKNRLSRCINSSFYAARLRLVFSSRRLIRQCVKNRLPIMSTSMCIYKFTCSCRADYIGRCKWALRKRVAEHYPVWLTRGERRKTTSSICEHLVECRHSATRDSSFKIIYKVKLNYSKGLRFHHLCTAEALAIHEQK